MPVVEAMMIPANDLEHRVLAWPRGRARTSAPARPVFLVHGYMDAAATWEAVAEDLALAGHTVFAPDMRGLGDGARAPRGSYYHFPDYVFDLADIVDAVAPNEPIALVGHSMGGTVATMYAGAFPERVVRLANVEGLGPPNSEWDHAPIRMRSWIEQVRKVRALEASAPTLSWDEARSRLAKNHPRVPAEVLDRWLPALAREVGEGRVVWRFDPLHRTVSPTPFFAQLFQEYARRVTCPVLFVSGGPTGFHPDDEDARLACFAELERRTIEDAGHMLHWTKPAALAAALTAFFG